MLGAAVLLLGGPALYFWDRHRRVIVCGEAQRIVRMLADSAVGYYLSADADGTPRRRFPPSTALTPDQWSRCVGAQPAPKVESAGPAWHPMEERLTGWYRYQYLRAPEGEPPGFTVRALGDLDCDGVYSTFERVVRVDPRSDDIEWVRAREIDPRE